MSNGVRRPRSALQITLAVWRALFIREVLTRFSSRRAGWAWIVLEPLLMIAVHMMFWGAIRVKTIAGINGGLFVMFGILGFMVVNKTAMRASHAVQANSSLFAYRQVLPVDTVLVRAFVEGSIFLTIFVLLLGAFALLGFTVFPEHPGQAMFAFVALWALGLGLGLVLSAVENLVPDIGNIVEVLFRILYFASVVFYPLRVVPEPYSTWLLYNPIVHGIELLRSGFFHELAAPPGVSALYLGAMIALLVFFGLALQLRFADRLVSE